VADLRVAIVGTADAANYGDLLFPLIAAHELRARLGDVELVSYGYRDVGASGWPFAVRSAGALAREIAGYDLLLVGGGLLIRDDAALADGYAPSDQSVHQPLGLWLVPTLLALMAGIAFRGRLDQRRFRQLIVVLLVLSVANLLWRSFGA